MQIESNSSLNTAFSCMKKYWFRYEERLEPKAYISSRSFGSFFHYLKECEHTNQEPHIEALIKDYTSAFPEYEEAIRLDVWLAERAAYQHTRYWNNVSGTDKELNNAQLDMLDAETEWKLPISQENLHVGKRDGYLYHKGYDKHLLYEIKTTGERDRENFLYRLRLDSQPSVNIVALREQQKPVDGVLYDIVWRPAIRRKTGRKTMPDETLQEFYNRMAEEYATEPHKYFNREFVMKTEKELAFAIQDAALRMDILKQVKSTGYPRNTDSCMKFGRLCAFFDVCMQPELTDLLSGFNKRTKRLPELSEKAQ